MENKKVILTITGSDSTGESGIQADVKTISELGGNALSVITSITIQNTLGIQEFYDLPADVIAGQIDAIMNDVAPEVVKIGMIRNQKVLDVLCRAILKYHPAQVIYHPVIFSARGEQLMNEDILTLVGRQLFPLCDWIIIKRKDIGYFHPNDQRHLLVIDETLPVMHGQTNAFASALAAYRCQGVELHEAIKKAHEYVVQKALRHNNLQGRSSELYNAFINLMHKHYQKHSDVQFYADMLNVSSRYLAQVTRRVSEQSPKAIIDDYLIKNIKRQLLTTQNNVQQIAYGLGFSSQAHMTRYFRKLTGLTPSKFRKQKD